MSFLLDTNLISELRKPQPDPGVVQWVQGQPETSLFLSVITIGEIYQGLYKLPEAHDRKRQRIQTWLKTDVRDRFGKRILPITDEIAERWGEIQGRGLRKGRPLPNLDTLIAATALIHSLTVVTRNIDDIERCGATAMSPWSD